MAPNELRRLLESLGPGESLGPNELATLMQGIGDQPSNMDVRQSGIDQMMAQGDQPGRTMQRGPESPPMAPPPPPRLQDMPTNELAKIYHPQSGGFVRNETNGETLFVNGQPGGISEQPYQGAGGGVSMGGVSMNQVPRQQQRIKVAGYGNDGIMSDLGETAGAVPPMDYSRPAVDTPRGKGYYGKDGAVYVKGPDGYTKILLGYDRDASYQTAKRNFDLQKSAADITQTEASTEHTQEATRASRMQNPDLGNGGAYGTPGVSGSALLQSLDPGIAAQVKAIAEGRQKPPTPIGGKISPLMTLVAQYDPTFDATDFNARYKAAQDFSPQGKSGQKVQSINQALHHAGQLSDSIDQLDNFNGIMTPLNAPTNFLEKTFGDPRQGQFQTKANALAAELRKVYAGAGGGTLEELKKWEGSFDQNASQEQQRAYLKAGMELLNGAIDSLKDSYTRGMGQHGDFGKLISPDAQANMDKIMRGKQPAAGNIPPGAAQLLRSNPGMKADFDAKYGAGAADKVLLGRG